MSLMDNVFISNEQGTELVEDISLVNPYKSPFAMAIDVEDLNDTDSEICNEEHLFRPNYSLNFLVHDDDYSPSSEFSLDAIPPRLNRKFSESFSVTGGKHDVLFESTVDIEFMEDIPIIQTSEIFDCASSSPPSTAITDEFGTNNLITDTSPPSSPSSSESTTTTANENRREFPTHCVSTDPIDITNFKHNLLQLYNKRLIERVKLADSDSFCPHCSVKFNDYLDLIDHFIGKDLMHLFHKRCYMCPVHKCPLHFIGVKKRGDLRHHVHFHHVVSGRVQEKYKKYEKEIKDLLYVCEVPNCGKCFYRCDSLTRHVKVVHK